MATGVRASAADAGLGNAAAQAFVEAKATCEKDGGALWGVSLCGPLLLVDPASRAVWANQPDKENQLKAEGDLFTGKLPNEINIANTAADWAGVKWTMVMLPLPEDGMRRAALLAHEMWHRIQDQIGLPASGAANNHLDSRVGRYWLQLEWRALAAALAAHGDERFARIVDAAVFRARRRELFPKAAAEESAMELHEGLAEYTGVRLSGVADSAQFVGDVNLHSAPAKTTFVRSFAYASGPAYGVLLDATGEEWRKSLRQGDDLANLLLTRTGAKLPADVTAPASERAGRYGGAEVAAAEEQRERRHRETVASYTKLLVDGAVLAIPLRQMNMQFNPGNLVALEGHGTVYPDVRIVDVWGVLTVSSGGALMSSDFTRVTVSAPTKTTATGAEGDGWKLELNQGWTVAARVDGDDFDVAQRK